MTKQLDFFEYIDRWREQARGVVYQISDEKWQAEIAGGWWIAIRDARQKAIDAVIRIYNDELDKHNQ